MKNKKDQDLTLAKLVLITVAIELITKVIDLIVAIYFSFVNYVKNYFISYSNHIVN